MSTKTIIDTDPWLEPYCQQIASQHTYIKYKSAEILSGKKVTDFALGHLYFGLHQEKDHWVFREWAPNADKLFLILDRTNWKDHKDYQATRLPHGVWELKLPLGALNHLDHYKLHIYWPGGSGERIPSYATYVVQDAKTNIFDAVVWYPEKRYKWQNDSPKAATKTPLIYEAHIGMSGDREAVSTYKQFQKEILPRIKDLGYNTVQFMAIQEHPYYGSYGYQVSNFFAASSRFGTPDDLKNLVDTAHGLGLQVILDVVHSHAVKNELEGLSKFDGTYTQYFHPGGRGNHPAWDSRVFDYGKSEVAHFLLSNIRFWLDEYHFDGFRFDGVTSMLYHDHGLGKSFTSYDDYYSGNTDLDALTYLSLANSLTHTINKNSLTIAEDTSAFPGLASPHRSGGIGFDYRLSMGVPDLWIKTLKEKKDEDWNLGELFHELTSHRPEEKTISYAESHDQALVGDKTLIFRLLDKNMYDSMQIGQDNLVVDRGLALHKMIRLFTASTNSGGYLNFMGNEFGHPEWIDFPRQGNNWSYKYARRQWSLVDNPKLKYQFLNNFDKAMTSIVKKLKTPDYSYVHIHESDKVISYVRDNLLFVFNFSHNSYTDYHIPSTPNDRKIVLSSDDPIFGGFNRVNTSIKYIYQTKTSKESYVSLYLPSRAALVLKAT